MIVNKFKQIGTEWLSSSRESLPTLIFVSLNFCTERKTNFFTHISSEGEGVFELDCIMLCEVEKNK